jgi:hypothetical protein
MKVSVAGPNVIIALRYISMVLAKDLDPNCQGFKMVHKWLFVITDFTVYDSNVIIALRYISMVLAQELDPNG